MFFRVLVCPGLFVKQEDMCSNKPLEFVCLSNSDQKGLLNRSAAGTWGGVQVVDPDAGP